MTTKFSEVFTLFLGQVDDYDLAIVGDDELDQVLTRYLMNSLSNLQDSMTDIDSIDFENNDFGADLKFVEKSIFAKAMKLEWLREKVYSAELMQKAIGDRDFSAVQGYNYLKEMSSLEQDLEKQIRGHLMEYSYREDFLDWLIV